MGTDTNSGDWSHLSTINNRHAFYFGTSITILLFAAAINVHAAGWLELNVNTSTSFTPFINGTYLSIIKPFSNLL